LTPERHKISSIYVSGGQVKNKALMQLLANVCGMPVVLPANSDAAVVLGAAILGRFAKEVSDWRAGHHGTDELSSAEQNSMLWNIMVRYQSVESSLVFLTALNLKAEMTPQGMLIEPAASLIEKRLLEAKYKIFLETIDIQKRWRKEMDEASKVSDISIQ
jgi:glycerol kinase